MKKPLKIRFYPPGEENLNIISHALGLILSLIGTVFLLKRALALDNLGLFLSFLVFGLSLVMLYLASTLYHSTKNLRRRYTLKIFDHIAIFILIAGTYTPFAVVTLNGSTGWVIFGIVWGIAIIGTILKLFFTGRYKFLSTLLYVGMGWVIIFAIEPLQDNLPPNGLWWLFSGGLAYTLGALVYSISNIKFNHAIFHLFVLAGSYCHFMAIYNYVLP